MFSLYFTALKSLAIKETNRYLRIWVQTLVPPVITTSLYFVIFGKMADVVVIWVDFPTWNLLFQG